MIKIFRKIRYKLMGENQMGKYFKYAIGEILLVVIGILIALQINNWNELNIQDKKNSIVIENLKDEFEENAIALSKDINRLDSLNHALGEVLKLSSLQNSDITQDDFENLLNETFTSPYWSPSSFVLNELKNSGALTQLNNNTLKKLLFKWEREFSKMKAIEVQYNKYSNEYVEFIAKYGSVRNLDAISGAIPGLEKSIITSNGLSLLKNPEFENRVDNFYFLAERLQRDYKKLLVLMNEIIKATESYD